MALKSKRIINKIADYGDFQEIYNLDIAIDAVTNLFGVKKRTYVMDPEYGIELVEYVYDKLDNISLEEIHDMLKEALSKYVPAVKLEKVQGYRGDRHTLIFDIHLKYRGNKFTIHMAVDGEVINILDTSIEETNG